MYQSIDSALFIKILLKGFRLMLSKQIGNAEGVEYQEVLLASLEENVPYVIDVSDNQAFDYGVIRKKDGKVYYTNVLIETDLPTAEYRPMMNVRSTGYMYTCFALLDHLEESQTFVASEEDVIKETKQHKDTLTLSCVHTGIVNLAERYFTNEGNYGSFVSYEAGEEVLS